MVRDLFQSAGGYDIFGVISTVIFLVFFFMVILYAFSLKKKDMDEFSRLPLDKQDSNSDEVKDI